MTMVTNEADGIATIMPTAESIEEESDLIGETAKWLLENGKNRIVFDLSNIKFIGDSGLSLLIRIHNTARFWEGTVGISGLHTEMRKVFQLTGLDKIFTIIPPEL